MKQSLLALALASMHLTGFAQSCEKMEYAQLKDSTQKELSEEYCSSKLKAELHEKLGKIQADLATGGTQTRRNTDEALASSRQHGDQQVACIREAEAAKAMLQKKFKAKPACKG